MTTLSNPEQSPGQYGATRQTWGPSPREVLRNVLAENPGASEKEVAEKTWERLKAEPTYIEALFQYWFTNNYRSFKVIEQGMHSVVVAPLVRTQLPRRPTTEIKAEQEKLKSVVRTVLMDHELANGKKLRDATFGECGQEESWMRAIAKCGRKNEIVGRKLTEKDLANLYRRATKKVDT